MKCIGILFFLMLLIPGCAQEQEQAAVQAVLIQRQQALNAKDATLYLSLISSQYRDKGKDYTAKKQELASNFATYERINYRSDGFTIHIKGDKAIASGRYFLRVVMGGKELNLEGDENLLLQKQSGHWKFISGL